MKLNFLQCMIERKKKTLSYSFTVVISWDSLLLGGSDANPREVAIYSRVWLPIPVGSWSPSLNPA